MPKEKRPSDIARESAPLPSEPMGTVATTVGTCKWFREENGVGAIATDAMAPFDVWCHFSAIEMEGFKALTTGPASRGRIQGADQDSVKYRAIRVRSLS